MDKLNGLNQNVCVRARATLKNIPLLHITDDIFMNNKNLFSVASNCKIGEVVRRAGDCYTRVERVNV